MNAFSTIFPFFYLLAAAVAGVSFRFFFFLSFVLWFQFAQPIGNRSLFLLNFLFEKCFSFFHLHMYCTYSNTNELGKSSIYTYTHTFLCSHFKYVYKLRLNFFCFWYLLGLGSLNVYSPMSFVLKLLNFYKHLNKQLKTLLCILCLIISLLKYQGILLVFYQKIF